MGLRTLPEAMPLTRSMECKSDDSCTGLGCGGHTGASLARETRPGRSQRRVADRAATPDLSPPPRPPPLPLSESGRPSTYSLSPMAFPVPSQKERGTHGFWISLAGQSLLIMKVILSLPSGLLGAAEHSRKHLGVKCLRET